MVCSPKTQEVQVDQTLCPLKGWGGSSEVDPCIVRSRPILFGRPDFQGIGGGGTFPKTNVTAKTFSNLTNIFQMG